MYLMEKNGEQMNVPPDKLDAYLQAGWKVLKTPDQNQNVVVNQPVAVETGTAEPIVVDKKPKGKSLKK